MRRGIRQVLKQGVTTGRGKARVWGSAAAVTTSKASLEPLAEDIATHETVCVALPSKMPHLVSSSTKWQEHLQFRGELEYYRFLYGLTRLQRRGKSISSVLCVAAYGDDEACSVRLSAWKNLWLDKSTRETRKGRSASFQQRIC